MFAVISSLSDCSMNVHHKCQTKVANLCGINQKLLAEALTQVSTVNINVCTILSYEALIYYTLYFSTLMLLSFKVCVYFCHHRNPPSDLKATHRATHRMLVFTRILIKVLKLVVSVTGGN